MNFSFASPALAAGALLFAVPLIIHLLNRRRFTPVKWAAQEFLLEAYRKTRRRLTLESLLLLLVRCALIVLLALALARPFVPLSNPLSMLTNSQRNLVVMIDTSYSMTRTTRGGDSALDRAKEQARQLIDQLSAERGDRVTLVSLSAAPQILVQESTRLDLVRDAISRLKPEWRGCDLVRGVELVDELVLAPATSHHEVFLFSDLQRLTFDPDDPSTADLGKGKEPASPPTHEGRNEALPAAALRRATSRDASFVIVDVGDSEPSHNLTVEDLVSSPKNVVKDNVVSFTATVKNQGATAEHGVRGSFVLNGRREQARTVAFDVPAHGTASVEFAASMKDEGFASVEFEIAEDEIPGDDRRFLAFPVRDRVNVLVVDGQYDKGDDLRSTSEFAAMLNPGVDDQPSLSPYLVKTMDDRRFNLGAETLSDYDMIVLADVGRIDEKIARELEDTVRNGAGLLIFAGDDLDLRAWNERLYREDGTGLLPARLVEFRGDAAADKSRAVLPRVEDLSHPLLELFRDPRLTSELRIPVMRYVRVVVGNKDAATATVLSLDDDAASPSPLILEKPAGHGRVVLFGTSIDSSWASFADGDNVMGYLSLIHEIAAFLTMPDLDQFNIGISDRLRRTERAIPSSIAIVLPNNERVALEANFDEKEHGRFVLPVFSRTYEPGIYSLDLEFPLAAASSAGEKKTIPYAVNLDPVESDPERIDAKSLASIYPNVPLTILDRIEVKKQESVASHEGELWKPMLYVIIALLAAEMALAAWFGRRSLGGRP